ncbi:small-conductance mechanosensitive channel [Xenococcus sp. PCC 7305]|uniref:DUF3375 domain-containing protein n=1 Tax=Xenococcus sp. PCC 7305 TaxID=102125 RepID=UPI0002ACF280|nr:DUF3375 domain-containing protein [Xenococcus sp. PCC 7305]ELS05225.1 small-conductance mechanosensitive channel [Xenococcus sp. PCC 7305]
MEHEKIQYDLENSPNIKLLKSRNAPLIVSFLYQHFKKKQQISIPESELTKKLEDYLEFLRDSEPDLYPRSPREYLNQWCNDDFLRKTYKADSDDPVFELTPATEQVITWLEDLEQSEFIGAESRFLQIFSLLKEIRDNSTEDLETRISQLEQERDRIQQEIDKIKQTGIVENYNQTQIQERFEFANSIARQLVADFRTIEKNFRELTKKITTARLEVKANKGSILDRVLDADEELRESNQGKSFYTFFNFLQSDSKQQELEILIEAVYNLEDLSASGSRYESLRRIKSRLVNEAQYIMQSNYRLAEKIRQLLDESNLEENRRVGELIREIQGLALKITESPPLEPNFWIFEGKPELNIFMDRPFHSLQESPSPSFALDLDNLPEVDLRQDLNEIYHQVYVDEDLLRDRLELILATRAEITLVELIRLYPISQGLAEIVAYIVIAKQDQQHEVNLRKFEYIDIDSLELGDKLSLNMPEVIFRRLH